ncbi:hypothetical protein L195_g056413, partial [Trifolium pratense]
MERMKKLRSEDNQRNTPKKQLELTKLEVWKAERVGEGEETERRMQGNCKVSKKSSFLIYIDKCDRIHQVTPPRIWTVALIQR